MFRFEHSEYLYALLLLPLVALLFGWAWRQRRQAIARFGDSALVARLASDMPGRRRLLFQLSLLLLAMAALIVGWANPQWGATRKEVKREGIDLFVALDISQSMLAADITPNRLERAKRFAQALVGEMAGSNVGVILFTCDAFIAAPLTTDYAFAQLALLNALPDQAGVQGTAIGAAIALAERSFREDSPNHRALVILSDGEDHDGSAAEMAGKARENGTLVFTVGVGRPEGEFVPAPEDEQQLSAYLRGPDGAPVRSVPDEASLREIAESGGGVYLNLGNNAKQLVGSLRSRIDSIEKREFEERAFTDFASYFQYFMAAALLFMVLEWLTSAGAWSRRA